MAGGVGNRNRKVTEKEGTAEHRLRGKVKRRSLPWVKSRLETLSQLTVATQRLSKGQREQRRKEGKEK